ncbi:hypothetical protein D3C83_70440 [compost metagenome]
MQKESGDTQSDQGVRPLRVKKRDREAGQNNGEVAYQIIARTQPDGIHIEVIVPVSQQQRGADRIGGQRQQTDAADCRRDR